ncbi:MAG: endolytic transglycosylase MltG [Epsilonproteobacteria bacterium]|nr:endolytic transglycosylase MltG [Campylobacterota bacterium]
MKKILKLLFSFIFLFSFSLILFYFYVQDYLKTPINNPKIIFIPRGSTKSVYEYFKQKGMKLNLLDYYLIKTFGYPQAGWIDLKQTNLSKRDFFYKITHSHAIGIKITIVPGETTPLILNQIAKKYDLNVTKLHIFYDKIAPYPEGVIFANTYVFFKGIKEKKLINTLISLSLNMHKKLSLKYLKSYDQKLWFEKYVTIASIIQKEAANKKEMPKIAAVIYNRLKKGMKLQMDGSLNYGLNSHKKITPQMIREDNSPFNTYKIKGLPPYPVCIVEEASIKAAIYPDKNNYLYFVKKDKNSHIFSTTYKEHLKHIKK